MSGHVLVTGSSGLLGVRLCEQLRERGYLVHGYDLRAGDDILDSARLANSIAGSIACVHLAAVADIYDAASDPERCERINVEGTRRVAEACRNSGSRLLYASTCCVYGNNGVVHCDETAPPAPSEEYARSKLDGERYVALAGQHSISMRLATFYGPGMRDSLAVSVFLRRALAGQPIEIHGDGSQTRCYTHVDDVARGIVTLLESPSSVRCVNVASDEVCSVLQLAQLAQQVAGVEVPLCFIDDRPGQIQRSAIDSSLLRSLGWAPQWRLAAGLRACADSLRRFL